MKETLLTWNVDDEQNKELFCLNIVNLCFSLNLLLFKSRISVSVAYIVLVVIV